MLGCSNMFEPPSFVRCLSLLFGQVKPLVVSWPWPHTSSRCGDGRSQRFVDQEDMLIPEHQGNAFENARKSQLHAYVLRPWIVFDPFPSIPVWFRNSCGLALPTGLAALHRPALYSSEAQLVLERWRSLEIAQRHDRADRGDERECVADIVPNFFFGGPLPETHVDV